MSQQWRRYKLSKRPLRLRSVLPSYPSLWDSGRNFNLSAQRKKTIHSGDRWAQNSHETSYVYIQSPTFTMISTMVEVWRRQRRNDVFNVWSGGDGVYGGSGWTGTFRVCTDSPLFCARTSLQTSVFTTIGLIISFPVWLYIVLQSLQMLNKRAHTVYIYTTRRLEEEEEENTAQWIHLAVDIGFH